MSKTMAIDDYVECPDCGVHPVENTAGGGTITTHLPNDRICLKNQLARLQAIVDKLPKTAEGVPIIPMMRVWVNEAWEDEPRKVIAHAISTYGGPVIEFQESGTITYPGPVYSTRKAAAEAAQKGNANDD